MFCPLWDEFYADGWTNRDIDRQTWWS